MENGSTEYLDQIKKDIREEIKKTYLEHNIYQHVYIIKLFPVNHIFILQYSQLRNITKKQSLTCSVYQEGIT